MVVHGSQDVEEEVCTPRISIAGMESPATQSVGVCIVQLESTELPGYHGTHLR